MEVDLGAYVAMPTEELERLLAEAHAEGEKVGYKVGWAAARTVNQLAGEVVPIGGLEPGETYEVTVQPTATRGGPDPHIRVVSSSTWEKQHDGTMKKKENG